MKRYVRRTFGICLLVAAWFSVAYAEDKAKDNPPAVAYEKGRTWGETVGAMRQALFAYKNSFVFSVDRLPAEADTIPIDVDISHAQHLWLVSSHRDRSVWCSPQLVTEDGTALSLSTLIPFSQEVGKSGLKTDTVAKAGQDYPKSLLVPGISKIGYKLNGKYKRFKASVGLLGTSSKGRVDFRVCTAPVYETLKQCAAKLFARIDADFPDYAQILLANGIEGARHGLLFTDNPLALLKKANANVLGQVQAYGQSYRDRAERLESDGTLEQWLALLDQVLALQIRLFQVRDRIKQAVPALGRFTHEFSLELELLSEPAHYLESHMDSQVLGTFQPVSEIEQIERALATIESPMLRGQPMPPQSLKPLGEQASALAMRLDRFLGWPSLRRDNQRSGVSHERIQLPLQVRWVHTPDSAPQPAWPPPAKINRAVQSPPLDPTLTYDRAFHTVVHDGLVYYGSSADDSVHCMELQTGKPVWTYTTNGPVRLAPALYAGKCYAGSDDGQLYCLNSKTGALLWTFRPGPETPWIPGNGRIISSFPVRCGICVSEDIVYFAAGLFPRQGTFLCAVNAETGKEIFVKALTCSPQGYMLLTPTRIVMPTGRTPFVVFDRKTGKRLQQLGRSDSWGQDLKGGSFALVIEDRVATGPSEDGHIHLFNAKRAQESVFRSAGQQVLISGPTAYILRKDSLLAIDRRKYLIEKKESLEWRVRLAQSYCMMMAGDTIFCGTDGGVYAIDAQTGARLWTAAVEGRVEGLVVSLGHLLVNTSNGKVYCFSETSPSRLNVDSLVPKTEMAVDAKTEQLASELVSLAKVKKGYFLLQDLGDVGLAAQLAEISDFRIVCAESDGLTIDTMRAQLLAAGLYGSRVVCHHCPEGVTPYQRYLFNAIVVNAGKGEGLTAQRRQSVQTQLRPHGGLLVVLNPNREQLRILGHENEWLSGNIQGTRFVCQYRSALAGEGTWTHPYADPGNSACSNDQLSFANTTVQWFGAPGPRDIVDRHQKSPPPVYAKGRVFVTGSDYIVAVDAYNGTILWENRLAESGRVGTLSNCGNMVAVDDRLYVAHGEFCTAFAAQTGQQVFQTSTGQANTEWGYLAHVNGLLLGSSGKMGSVDRPLLRVSGMTREHAGLSCSAELFACDPKTGKRLWSYRSANGAIINPAIACSGNRMCFLESLDPKTRQTKFGRARLKTLLDPGARLVALDIMTGTQAWEAKPDLQNVQFIVYLSATKDTVIVTGSCQKEIGSAVKNRYSMLAYDSASGRQLWTSIEVPGYQDAIDGNHGALNQHPAIVDDIIYGNGYARYVRSGQEYAGWAWTKSHKCATLSASAHCAFSRYEGTKLPFMFDLKTGTRQALTTVSRPGCWINTLPVGGLVLIPEASAGCTCGYSIQTSLALSPEPSDETQVVSPGK